MRNNEVERIVKQAEIRFQKTLKHRIEKIAEEQFFKTTPDLFLPENVGLVLEKGLIRIACLILIGEFSVADHYCLGKCLDNSYDRIVVCTNGISNIEKLRELCFKEVPNEDKHKIVVLNPDRLTKYLGQFKNDWITTEEVKGWKVNVEFKEVSADDAEQRISAVLSVLASAHFIK